MTRFATVLAIVVSLVGAPAAAIACGVTCEAGADPSHHHSSSGACHQPSGSSISGTHACEHITASDPAVLSASKFAPGGTVSIPLTVAIAIDAGSGSYTIDFRSPEPPDTSPGSRSVLVLRI